MSRRTRIAMAGAAVLLLGVTLTAQDWTGWRGPNRDGVVQVAGPAAWPDSLSRSWEVEVGEGYANPLFAAGRIFQFAKQNGEEVAMAIDPDSGELVVVEATATGFEPVRRYQVSERATYTHPLVLSDGIVVKDTTTLSRLSWE